LVAELMVESVFDGGVYDLADGSERAGDGGSTCSMTGAGWRGLTVTSVTDWSGFTESGDVERTGRTVLATALLLRTVESLRFGRLRRLCTGLLVER